jgi:hypothetical protein
MARGWAIDERGEIIVKTVSPSRIGAMVNWLVASVGIAVSRGAADDLVEATFDSYALQAGARLIEVTIKEVD